MDVLMNTQQNDLEAKNLIYTQPDKYKEDDGLEGKKEMGDPRTAAFTCKHFHDHPLSGRPGMKETIHEITKRYTWASIHQDLCEYVCQ
ncbi:hypothetical protein PR048_001339 [Dryococelus australis]|uniref:Integrase zinc-binding domain-containing protein n=1 Tax=Dryococelus australis TaxID=614101 RepID=A0ABQ9IH28_9NEOP|nr:hypothetical protein PR048_001339 [Dryococelus australis]